MPSAQHQDAWPALPYQGWEETRAALHLWTQVVGKVRLALTPWLNHSWHVPLYVTARGLTTSPIPYEHTAFDMEFDFLDHALRMRRSDGGAADVALAPQSVAEFYAKVMGALEGLGISVQINELPSEIRDAVRFSDDVAERPYDGDAAQRFWRALVQCDRVFKQFRTGFIGKSSPVHFFWGSFDLAASRFSGRRAPPHPGGIPGMPNAVAREAYSHEVSSAGFWPGGNGVDYAAFYAYAYPEPPGFRSRRVKPAAGGFNEALGEFVLPYDAVRSADDPDKTLLAFLQSTYDAAADSAAWDRSSLECVIGGPGVPRPT